MKKLFLLFVIAFTMLFSGLTSAQSSKYEWLPQDSWSFGFGGIYPRYLSTNLNVVEGLPNLGGFVSIQRNFSEHVGLRLKVNYIHMQGHVGGPTGRLVGNNLFGGNFDLLYYFAPSEPVSPYFGFGIGGFTHSISNSPTPSLNGSQADYQYNLIFGTEWTVSTDWRITTELAYHNAASTGFDGFFGTSSGSGGIFSGNNDSYLTIDFGVAYYFKKGPASKLNDLYTGLKTDVDYDRIESMIKKYSVEPTNVDYDRIENIVKKYQSVSVGDKWYLIGVNFDFNKANLKPESMPILYNAAEILLSHPDLNIEIQGYTDNTGSEKYNLKLSQKRANAVRDFLISKGVSASRLAAVGFGEASPIMDNRTAAGRAFNRRIEFKVK